MKLSNFKVMGEDNTHFHIAHPKGKQMKIEKSGISEKAHKLIQGLKPQKFEEGGEVLDISQPQELPPSLQSPSEHSLDSSSAEELVPQQPQPNVPASPQMSAPTNASSGELGAQGTPPQQMLPGMSLTPGLQEQQQANKEIAQAESGEGKAEQQAIEKTQSYVDAMPTQKDIIAANKSKDDALFKSYQDQKIDPNRYYNNLGTGQKIANGIAMLLSGAGSGVTGQPNMAASMIQNAINRDIESQRSNKEGAYNLWKMNREALGSDLAANLATQNQMYTGLKYNLMKAQSQFKGPEAMARAKAANALIDQQIGQNRFKMSLMDGPTKENQDPASLVPWLVPDHAQAAVNHEIEKAEYVNRNLPKMLDEYDKALKWDRSALVPGMDNPHRAALHQLMLPAFKGIDGTVRQAAMDETWHNINPSPWNRKETVEANKKALTDWATSESSAPTAKNWGIDLSKYRNTQAPKQKVAPVERQTKDGKIAYFNPETKDFMGYKK